MALNLAARVLIVMYPVFQRIYREPPRARIHFDFSIGMQDISVAQHATSTEKTS